jgi:tRNA 5-methylaminomethyl-2-thiouridine biosynthesis bifunctional protein
LPPLAVSDRGVQITVMSDLVPHHSADYRLIPAVISQRDGILRADDFDDLYFSADNGLAETQHVFLCGNKIAKRLPGVTHFTIAEIGFGTGLNFLALMKLLENMAKKQLPICQIDYVSFEARPLPSHIMGKSHCAFPEIKQLSKKLLAALPPNWPGLHRCDFLEGKLRLHLLYGEANDALANAEFVADAWFLDGFSPAKNPELWNRNLLLTVGRLTRENGSFATFTAASKVRQNLVDAGFHVEKRQGFGRKRDMLIGRKLPKSNGVTRENLVSNCNQKLSSADQKIVIIGGGIAGTALAAGLASRGVRPHIVEAGECFAVASSGNRLALQSPRLSVDHNIASRMSADCLSYAARTSDAAKAVVSSKTISLDWPDREAARQAKFRKQFWPEDLMQFVDAETASDHAGVKLSVGGVLHDYGRVIDPTALTRHLGRNAQTSFGFNVVEIGRDKTGFHLVASDGRQLSCDRLVFAGGADLNVLNRLLSITGITVDITSGQVSQLPTNIDLSGLQAGISFGGYLTPAKDGYHDLGATFDRLARTKVLESAHYHNRDLLPPDLSVLMPDPKVYGARVSRRASTPDRNPVCGEIAENLYILGALGARGLTLAPLLGDMMAAQMLGMPVTLGLDIRFGLDPFRFRLRAGRAI